MWETIYWWNLFVRVERKTRLHLNRGIWTQMCILFELLWVGGRVVWILAESCWVGWRQELCTYIFFATLECWKVPKQNVVHYLAPIIICFFFSNIIWNGLKNYRSSKPQTYCTERKSVVSCGITIRIHEHRRNILRNIITVSHFAFKLRGNFHRTNREKSFFLQISPTI